MVANTSPIYSIAPAIGFTTTAVKTASNIYDGTAGTTVIFTAGSNGSFVRSIKTKPNSTNIATVVRFWLNNGSTSGTAANNVFFAEFSLPAITASATTAQPEIEIPFNIGLPANWTIICAVATTVANGWYFAAIAGNY